MKEFEATMEAIEVLGMLDPSDPRRKPSEFLEDATKLLEGKVTMPVAPPSEESVVKSRKFFEENVSPFGGELTKGGQTPKATAFRMAVMRAARRGGSLVISPIGPCIAIEAPERHCDLCEVEVPENEFTPVMMTLGDIRWIMNLCDECFDFAS